MKIPAAYFLVNYICPHCKGPQKRKIRGLPAGSRLSSSSFWCPQCQKPVSLSIEFGESFAGVLAVWKTPSVG